MSRKLPDSAADDELMVFAEEQEESNVSPKNRYPWRVLIADDEKEVHSITKIALKDFQYDGKGLEFLHAYSGREVQETLAVNTDVAIVLLDVVMESDVDGLEAARYIREELKNNFVRIILRTGQPGKAPEREVISDYDINDYKEKTELTAQKLFTTVTTSLRSYRDMRTIEKNRQGLEKIIQSSGQLLAHRRLKAFTEGVLIQMASLFQTTDDSLLIQSSGFAAADDQERLKIIAATGQYHNYIGKYVDDELPDNVKEIIQQAIARKATVLVDGIYVGYFQTENQSVNILYLDGFKSLSSLDKDMIRLFSSNVAVAFDNVYLGQEIIETQKEIIETLMEIVETRSEETAQHVHRVSELSYILALRIGIPEDQAQLLRMAATMHDVGKIGIPDAILNKPGQLSPAEYEMIKGHTNIGGKILCKSNRRIIKTAAIIAEQHHEKWDGTGYPNQLKGTDIHLYGRVVGLVDVFDALCHKRAYKSAMAFSDATKYISDARGTHFDPELVDVFLQNIDEFVKINEKYPDDPFPNR